MWKKYFSKYKWTDLFWILLVIWSCLYMGNSTSFPLTHQENLFFMDAVMEHHLPYITCYFIDKFVISNRK